MNVERLRASFLAQAVEDAEQAVAAAEEERRARLDEAQRLAGSIVASARAAGKADARVEAARTTSVARRRARTLALGARLELYEELRRQALAAAAQLRTEPSYTELLQRLERAALADLGADAVVDVDPRESGGIVARARSRIVDYSLPALVDRCVHALGPRVEELW